MGLGDVFAIVIMIALVFAGSYLLYSELNRNNVDYKEFVANQTANIPNQSIQFFPNMRFLSANIPYSISEDCNSVKRQDIDKAMEILESKTIIHFVGSSEEGISFACSENLPSENLYDPDSGHIIAGSAKPEDIINASNFFIIKKGVVALPSAERCENPQVAIHEILHALGFDHSSNQKSIMFPISQCNQEIDSSIIEEINRLYAIPNNPDLVMEKIQVNQTGRYVNLFIKIANYGLADAQNVNLVISSNSKILKEYSLEKVGLGRANELTITNLRYDGNGELIFELRMSQTDLNPADNRAEIMLSS